MYLIGENIPLRDSNRSYFAQTIRHGTPFLIEDIYSKEQNIGLLSVSKLNHVLKIGDESGDFHYYKTLVQFERVSPHKDIIRIADAWTNFGFKVLEEIKEE